MKVIGHGGPGTQAGLELPANQTTAGDGGRLAGHCHWHLDRSGHPGYLPLAEAKRRGVHLLGRMSKHVVFDRTRVLGDGSYLATIHPSTKDRRHQANGLVVRIIEYTLDEPNRTGHDECHRLVTTLLDADVYPRSEEHTSELQSH